MMERGYLKLFRFRGIPIRAHWTLPLGVLMFSGGRVAPGLWLGIVALIVLHELGHAALVHRAGLVNLGIDITGFGGRCTWAGSPTPTQRALIAWGGVLAQLVLLALTGLPLLVLGAPSNAFLADLVHAFTATNLVLMALNLIPIRPLDGAEAWPLFGHLWREAKRRRKWKRRVTHRRAANPDAAAQTLTEALREAERRRTS